MKIIDTSKLRFYRGESSNYSLMEIDDEHIYDSRGYETKLKEEILALKPLGRIYVDKFNNLDYSDGTPVEKPIITYGELGMINKYMKPGARVYTDEMVVNIIQSRIYEQNEELKPKLPVEVFEFLTEIANNKAKNKPKRAKELLTQFKVVGGSTNENQK